MDLVFDLVRGEFLGSLKPDGIRSGRGWLSRIHPRNALARLGAINPAMTWSAQRECWTIAVARQSYLRALGLELWCGASSFGSRWFSRQAAGNGFPGSMRNAISFRLGCKFWSLGDTRLVDEAERLPLLLGFDASGRVEEVGAGRARDLGEEAADTQQAAAQLCVSLGRSKP